MLIRTPEQRERPNTHKIVTLYYNSNGLQAISDGLLIAMASNLIVMAHGLQPNSNGLEHKEKGEAC